MGIIHYNLSEHSFPSPIPCALVTFPLLFSCFWRGFFCCKAFTFVFILYFYILYTNHNSPSLPSSHSHHPNAHPLLNNVKASHGEAPKFSISSRGRTKPLSSVCRLTKVSPQRELIPKSSSSTRDKSFSQCQCPHRLPKPHKYHPHLEVLLLSYAGSPATSLESVSSHYLASAVSVGFPIIVLTPWLI